MNLRCGIYYLKPQIVIFTVLSKLQTNFPTHITHPNRVWGHEIWWSTFTARIVDTAARSCGLKAIGALRGGNPTTRWLKLGVTEAVKLKKVGFWGRLAQGSFETAEMYREATRAEAAVVHAKSHEWEEFGEGMERLSGGLKGVLRSNLTTEKRKAGLAPGCSQQVRWW